ncbi:hypothetical protein J437_LFUL011458 [Ladona fulva]|uniref:Tc1-like transposase DDE domain-containing protein n=1 Tax=Ladona fulva TaxID=123851 RepID=A0A8K0KS44_LADFU|nr:hypothetical protein J437_LFUL011458 [Ladona fulva]
MNKAWRDQVIKTPHDTFLSGLSTGLKAPTCRGGRFAIIHTRNENEFIEGALQFFFCKKNTTDEHEEVDRDSYESWFENCLLSNVPRGSVIVLDNASYHSRKLEYLPLTSWKKDRIKGWLTSKNINFHNDCLKRDLLFLVDQVRKDFEKFRVDELAKSKGCSVLRLPPYHCELNPIEMVWAQIKHYVNTLCERSHITCSLCCSSTGEVLVKQEGQEQTQEESASKKRMMSPPVSPEGLQSPEHKKKKKKKRKLEEEKQQETLKVLPHAKGSIFHLLPGLQTKKTCIDEGRAAGRNISGYPQRIAWKWHR